MRLPAAPQLSLRTATAANRMKEEGPDPQEPGPSRSHEHVGAGAGLEPTTSGNAGSNPRSLANGCWPLAVLPERRERQERGPREDGADRSRSGPDRGPQGPGGNVRAGDREEAAMPARVDRGHRALPLRAKGDPCIVHLMRNTFEHAARQDRDATSRALKPTYQAATVAEERFLEFQEQWGQKYPAIVRLWDNAWAEFVPFLGFDRETRRILRTTTAIESVNARTRNGPHPECRPGARAPPERASRAQVRLPRRDCPRPERHGSGPADATLEAGAERVRRPLRRPPQRITGPNHSEHRPETHRLLDRPGRGKLLTHALPEGGDARDVVADHEGVHFVRSFVCANTLEVVRVSQW